MMADGCGAAVRVESSGYKWVLRADAKSKFFWRIMKLTIEPLITHYNYLY
jgi:hypothetical protein